MELNNTENLLSGNLVRIIDRGTERRDEYIRTINLRNAQVSVVGD